MAEDLYGRTPPFSLEAEQSVLGSILIEPESFNLVAGILKSEDFYVKEHIQIFLAMQELYLRNQNIDAVTLMNTLVRTGVYKTEENSGDYLKTLVSLVPTAANIVDYVNIVKDKAQLRQLIEICTEINEEAYNESEEAQRLVGMAEERIFSLAQGEGQKELTPIRDVLTSVYSDLQLRASNPDAISGTVTGFSQLDDVLVNLGKSDLVLIGARPGMGKTSFAMNIAANIAKQSQKAVCVFSLEMSKEQLVSRMLSSEALVDSHNIRSGNLSQEEWEHLAGACNMLSGCDIRIDDTAGITVSGMKAKLRRVEANKLGLIVIDYLQLMQSDRRIDNKVQEVAEISRNLKILAKDLNVPVICCAQLSRGPESRTDKRPMLSDLRDSGAIEQDADIVLFLYRDEYYKTDAKSEASTAEIIIAKNRHGAVGKVEMGWLPSFTKFVTRDQRQE